MKITVWTREHDIEVHEDAQFTVLESGALAIRLDGGTQVVYAPAGWYRLETSDVPTQ